MTEYYIFKREPGIHTSWQMEDTIWSTSKDAIDALMFLSKNAPDTQFLVGFAVDGGKLIIPNMIGELHNE